MERQEEKKEQEEDQKVNLEKGKEYQEYKEYQKTKAETEKETILWSQKQKDEEPINPNDQNKFFLKQKEKEQEELIAFKEKVKTEVLTFLAQKDTKQATQGLKTAFKTLHPVYSIRNDKECEIYIYNEGVYYPNGKSYIKEFCDEMVGFNLSTQLINEVILKIEVSSYIEQDKFYELEPKDEIAVFNGVLNIKTKKLKRFTPRKVFLNKVPIIFQPGARPDKSIKFFQEILENPEDVGLVQELLGYLFLKDYQIEKAFMFLGKGRNGKGQLLELIKNLIGPENCSAISLQKITNEGNFAVVELHNKLVNIGGDIPDTSLQDTGLLKSLTGNDLISCDRKFKSHIKFKNYAKLIFACNKLPKTKDNSVAFWDRWVLLKFPYRFEYAEIIDKLPDKEKKMCKIRKNNIIQEITTEEEKSGLLNWALDGLQRLLETQHFTFTKSTQNIRKRWINEADSFAAFCDEQIEYCYDQFIKKDELRQAYNEFCKRNQVESVTDKHIHFYLTTELGSVAKQSTDEGFRFWKNITFSKKNNKPNNHNTINTPTLKQKSFNKVESACYDCDTCYKSSNLTDLLFEFGNNADNVITFDIISEKYTEKIINLAKEHGFIYEFQKGKFKRVV